MNSLNLGAPLPPPGLSSQPALGPSIIILTGVARNVRESHLQQMVSKSNVGFQRVHMYTSCTCRPCQDPMTHPGGCICIDCGDPSSHRSWAIFVFGNQLAAEYGMAEIKYQVLRTLPQLCWTPQSLSIQHSDAQPLLSHEERRLRLEELDAVIAAGNARLPPGEAKAPPPPPPLLESTAKKVAVVIGESEKLLKQPVIDAPPEPAINETATTAAPPPPDPSAAATGSGGDGDTLLPDLGGSDCDSADILAGYATSPVTSRQLPQKQTEEVSKKRKAAELEPVPAASPAVAAVESSGQQLSKRQQSTEAPGGSREPGRPARASAAAEKNTAHRPESTPQLGNATGHKTAQRGLPQKQLKSLFRKMFSSKSPRKGNSGSEAAPSLSPLQTLAQSTLDRSKQQQQQSKMARPRWAHLSASEKPQQGSSQPQKEQTSQEAKAQEFLSKLASNRPGKGHSSSEATLSLSPLQTLAQSTLVRSKQQQQQSNQPRPPGAQKSQQGSAQPQKQTTQEAIQRDFLSKLVRSKKPRPLSAQKPQQGSSKPQKQTPQEAKEGDKAAARPKTAAKNARGGSDGVPKGATAAEGGAGGGHAASQHPVPGSSMGAHRPNHSSELFKQAASNRLKGAKGVSKAPSPLGKQQQRPCPAVPGCSPQAGRRTKATVRRKQTPNKGGAEAAATKQQLSGTQRNGKAAASQQPGDGTGSGNNGNAAAPRSLASLIRKKHTGKFAPALDTVLPLPPPPADRPGSATAAAPVLPPLPADADRPGSSTPAALAPPQPLANRPGSSTAAAPALPLRALALAVVPAVAQPPPSPLPPPESQLVVYSPPKLAARLEVASLMESGALPPNKSLSEQVKALPPRFAFCHAVGASRQ